jgi:ribonuclease HI
MEWWSDLNNLTMGLHWKIPKPSITMTTDASLLAWGAHADGKTVQGKWTMHQSLLHINVLELMAVQRGLKAFQSFLRNKSILVQTDNSTVISYINKAGGTRSPVLCQVAWEIFNFCILNKIQLQAVHIPGSNNLLADKLSRHLLSPTEWELNDRIVLRLFHMWTSPSIDFFASYQNKKLPKFCSLFHHPEAIHQDALSMSWNNLYVYAFPPLAILNLVLRKVASENVTMILIAPQWTRREWYPLLLDLLIDVPYRLPVMRDIVSQQQGTHLHHNPAELSLVAWLISGMPSLRKAFQEELRRRVLPQGAIAHTGTTNQAGTIFLPGVQDRILIPMNHLSLT